MTEAVLTNVDREANTGVRMRALAITIGFAR